jgi:hypothetical protein
MVLGNNRLPDDQLKNLLRAQRDAMLKYRSERNNNDNAADHASTGANDGGEQRSSVVERVEQTGAASRYDEDAIDTVTDGGVGAVSSVGEGDSDVRFGSISADSTIANDTAVGEGGGEQPSEVEQPHREERENDATTTTTTTTTISEMEPVSLDGGGNGQSASSGEECSDGGDTTEDGGVFISSGGNENAAVHSQSGEADSNATTAPHHQLQESIQQEQDESPNEEVGNLVQQATSSPLGRFQSSSPPLDRSFESSSSRGVVTSSSSSRSLNDDDESTNTTLINSLIAASELEGQRGDDNVGDTLADPSQSQSDMSDPDTNTDASIAEASLLQEAQVEYVGPITPTSIAGIPIALPVSIEDHDLDDDMIDVLNRHYDGQDSSEMMVPTNFDSSDEHESAENGDDEEVGAGCVDASNRSNSILLGLAISNIGIGSSFHNSMRTSLLGDISEHNDALMGVEEGMIIMAERHVLEDDVRSEREGDGGGSDGTVASLRKKVFKTRRHTVAFVMVLLALISAGAVGISFAVKQSSGSSDNGNDENDLPGFQGGDWNMADLTAKSIDTNSPTLSPTITSSPTQTADVRRDIVLSLLEPMIGNNGTSTGVKNDITIKGTPQYKALQWLESSVWTRNSSFNLLGWSEADPTEKQQRILQRYALAVIYYATGGDIEVGGWKDDCHFLSDRHECLWVSSVDDELGTGCEGDGQVMNVTLGESILILLTIALCNVVIEQVLTIHSIDKVRNGLTGTIPKRLSDGLPHLKSFDVSFNGVTGTIPEDIGSFAVLQAFLAANNQISGTLPSSIGNIATLRVLNLAKNKMVGVIPSEVSNLVRLGKLYLCSLVSTSLNCNKVD